MTKNQIKKLGFLVLLFVIFLIIFLPKKDNNSKIILISIDTVNPYYLGAYGNNNSPTPTIDKIAQEGVIFNRGYTPIPATIPAHISLFSGTHPADYKIFGNTYIHENVKNLPSIAHQFKKNGYVTASFTSSHLLSPYFFQEGFDTSSFPENDGMKKDSETTMLVNNWIKKNYQNDFFLFIHYFGVARFEEPQCSLQPETKNDIDDIKKIKYINALFCVDKEIEKIITTLKKLDVYKDATIIIVSDHGIPFNKNRYNMFQLKEENIKIPIIIKGPSIDSSTKTINQPISLLNVNYIINQIIKREVSRSKKKIDLNDIVTQQNIDLFFISNVDHLPYMKETEDSLSISLKERGYQHLDRAIISNNKKLTLKEHKKSLYNITDDPFEKNNLYSNEEQTEVINELSLKLNNFFQELSVYLANQFMIEQKNKERKALLEKLPKNFSSVEGLLDADERFTINDAYQVAQQWIEEHSSTYRQRGKEDLTKISAKEIEDGMYKFVLGFTSLCAGYGGMKENEICLGEEKEREIVVRTIYNYISSVVIDEVYDEASLLKEEEFVLKNSGFNFKEHHYDQHNTFINNNDNPPLLYSF